MVKVSELRRNGFTLIELLVVMAIVSVLLSIVTPRYMRQADRAKEAALMENLNGLRQALDHYYSDQGVYPERLGDLLIRKYLRQLPVDPFTERRDTWVPGLREGEDGKQSVEDVHSGAPGNAMNGTPFVSW